MTAPIKPLALPKVDRLPRSIWALMLGNFVIGTGVMVVPGTLNEIARSLAVSVPQAGMLITAGAILMGAGAPLFAALVAGWDRRKLLALCLLWYGLTMGASAFAPSYGWLLALRIITVVAPPIFTPQAAASVGLLVPEHLRGRAITFAFLGWSVASVLGVPLAAWIGGTLGWRWSFGLTGVMSLLCAAWVWRELPNGLRTPALSRQAWGQALGSPAIMLTVAVTLVSSSGQFTLFAYFAPYLEEVMSASPTELSLMYLWLGAFGVVGNMLISHRIDRLGPSRAVAICLAAMAVSLLMFPLGLPHLGLLAVVMLPWAASIFASNSAQQARLVHLDPGLASATISLNSSAIYAGQAIGAAAGGAIIASGHMAQLNYPAFALLTVSLAISIWAAKIQKRKTQPAPQA
ncbi:MFS transporter [Hydrogenophaga sp. 5NK40-0174]|uniref:MFS transporter n=1 Tax=Hydrogenophaga sp. 5NK40-0174 TaxID=3127649 RepID=UPI00310340E7